MGCFSQKSLCYSFEIFHGLLSNKDIMNPMKKFFGESPLVCSASSHGSARTPLGPKVCGVWSTANLVFFFGPNLSLKLKLWIWTKPNNICRDFTNGICPYVESVCWYIHSETTNASSTVLTRSSCKICEEIITCRSELMHHNKKKHKTNVPF